MDITTFSIAGIGVVALIIGLVKAAREAGLPSKFAPLLSIVIGIIIGVTAALYASSAVYIGILGGIAAGLMSCGLYDVGKKAE